MALYNCFCCVMGNTNVLIVATGFKALFLTSHVMYSESFVRHIVLQHTASLKFVRTIWCVSNYSGV